jgi:DMSO/TMAO reductase YedYZ molybdopterin-dependent catalytic subunit
MFGHSVPFGVLMLVLTSVIVVMPSTASAEKNDFPGGVPAVIHVSGDVAHPTTYTEAQLRAFTPSELYVWCLSMQGVIDASYVGVLLWDILTDAGVHLNPANINDINRFYVRIIATNGFQVTLALAEIAPRLGGQQALLAYEQNGAPLGDLGFARLVMPGDKWCGRSAFNVAQIQVHSFQPLGRFANE